MFLGFDEPKSLGEMILQRMGQANQNALMRSQLDAQNIQNQFAPKKNELYLKQAQEQGERKNKLFPLELKKQQLELENFQPRTEAEMAYKQAQTNKLNFLNENPLYGQPGAAGQLGAAELLKRNPQLSSTPGAANLILNALNTNQNAKQSLADLNYQRASGYSFNSLPMNDRSYLLAQAAGMGIEPNEAIKRFNKGETVDQMASAEGYDPNNKPEPVYPLTPAGQTQLKMRQAANDEIKVLGKKISDAMAPYSRKILGYSPKQISEALKGKNEESQAKLLAARALQPELASIRLRMGGGNVGIEAIREMTNSSMGHINNLQALVSPEVYSKTNEYVDQWLTDAVDAANKRATQGVAKKSQKNEDNDPLGIR